MNQPVFKLPEVDPALNAAPSINSPNDNSGSYMSDRQSKYRPGYDPKIPQTKISDAEIDLFVSDNFLVACNDDEFCLWAFGKPWNGQSAMEKMEAWNIKHASLLELNSDVDVLKDVNKMYKLYLDHKYNKDNLFVTPNVLEETADNLSKSFGKDDVQTSGI